MRIAQMIVRMTIGLTDGGRRVLTVAEAGLHGVDDGVEREPTLLVQLRREPHLGVHDAVSGEVERGFASRPDAAQSSVCITASVCANVARYWRMSRVSAPLVNQAASSCRSVAGRSR